MTSLSVATFPEPSGDLCEFGDGDAVSFRVEIARVNPENWQVERKTYHVCTKDRDRLLNEANKLKREEARR